MSAVDADMVQAGHQQQSIVAETDAWMRCLCHSDVNERMNNARPHYTYCRDDVNPPLRPIGLLTRAPSADAWPTSPRIRRRVYAAVAAAAAGRLRSVSAHSGRRQVCLNNSSTRRRDTRRPAALCAKMRRRVHRGLLAGCRSCDLRNRSWDAWGRHPAESHERRDRIQVLCASS